MNKKLEKKIKEMLIEKLMYRDGRTEYFKEEELELLAKKIVELVEEEKKIKKKTSINKRKFKRIYWFERDLVWFPKAYRAETERNVYALKQELILRIADELKKTDKKWQDKLKTK